MKGNACIEIEKLICAINTIRVNLENFLTGTFCYYEPFCPFNWIMCLEKSGEVAVGIYLDILHRIRVALATRLGALYLLSLKATGRVRAGEHVVLRGIPRVEIRAGSAVRLGSRIILNSCSLGYHLNMFAPVKLMADRTGAMIDIGDDTRIHGSCIHAQQHISIGARCLIAANCQIMDNSGHDVAEHDPESRIKTSGAIRPVFIEDDVWLGAGVVVLPGVRIGRGSVVGAGSVVAKDIPPMSFAGGVPSRVLRSLGSEGSSSLLGSECSLGS